MEHLLKELTKILALRGSKSPIKPWKNHPGYYTIADINMMIKLDKKKKTLKPTFLDYQGQNTAKSIIDPRLLGQ